MATAKPECFCNVGLSPCPSSPLTVVSVAEPESKDLLIDEALVDHVVEGRDHVLDRDGVVREAEDTVKLSKRKRESRLLCRLAKVLVLDLEVADGQDIVRNDPLHRTGAVVDLELGPVGLVRRRSLGVAAWRRWRANVSDIPRIVTILVEGRRERKRAEGCTHYLACRKQAMLVHRVEGTQRLDD